MKIIKSLFISALALTLASCANDEVIENFSGDTTSKEQSVAGTIFTTGEDVLKTRTSMETDLASYLNYFWEATDKISVKNGASWVASGNATLKDSKGRRADFVFAGSPLAAPEYMVYYTGNGSNNEVSIPAEQIQAEAGSHSHFGMSGDCGVAKAVKGADGHYHFTLHHKAAIVAFTPYSTLNLATTVKVRSITFKATEASNGTFTLPDTEEGALAVKNAGTTTTKVTVTSGAPFPNAKGVTNAVYMVLKPGNYTNVEITYNISDSGNEFGSEVSTSFVKKYPSLTISSNQVLPAELKVDESAITTTPYDYYYWGAQVRYPIDTPGSEIHEDSPAYWSNATTCPPGTATAACPNINELRWYVEKGDIHWDDAKLWCMHGHLYKGGIWIKKQQVIATENSATTGGSVAYLKTKAPNGVDYETNVENAGSIISSVPNVATQPLTNADDYFFLPAAGEVEPDWKPGELIINNGSWYLCSTANNTMTSVNEGAVALRIEPTLIEINTIIYRSYVYKAWTAQ